MEFLGRGDLHDSKYDYLEDSTVLEARSRSELYTGVPVDKTYCPYNIRVFPSKDREDDFVTSRPVYLTIAVVVIFAFTSTIFLIYDYCVELRQKKLMRQAVHLAINVSVLKKMVYQQTQTFEETNK